VDNIKVDMQEVGCCAWTGMIWLMLGKMACSSDLYNFTACPFAGIPRNCTCAGLFRVLTGGRQAYLSQLYIHRVNALYRSENMSNPCPDGRTVLLAEK